MEYRKIKQIGAFAFALIAMAAYVLSYQPRKENISVAAPGKDSLEIVLLDNQLDCVPFTVAIEENADLTSKINKILEAMQAKQTQIKDFKGFFGQNVALISAVQEGSTLKLDFNQAFGDIDPALELKFLEAMSYVFTQFEGVTQFEFSLEGELVNRLPNGKLSIQQPMNRSLALNNFDSVNSTFHRAEGFVVAISKKMSDFSYTTLKSIRSNSTLIESIENYYTRKDSILIDSGIKFKQFDLSLENEILTLTMSSEILTPQKTCDEKIIHEILLTLKSNFDVKQIKVVVEEVTMLEVEPSSINFNQI